MEAQGDEPLNPREVAGPEVMAMARDERAITPHVYDAWAMVDRGRAVGDPDQRWQWIEGEVLVAWREAEPSLRDDLEGYLP